MADFTCVITSGGSTVPWTDTASTSPVAPSRLTPDPEHLPTRRVVHPGDTLVIQAKVDGVVGSPGPDDTFLAGRLFTASWGEWSGSAPPAIVQTPGFSATVSVPVISTNVGHQVLVMSRLSEDASCSPSFGVHFDVEP